MLFLAPAFILLTSTVFQLPATPPMKMGLWESTSSTAMNMPGMNMPPRTSKIRSCMTPEAYAKDLAQQNQQRDCQGTNQSFTGHSYSADISCSRTNASGHIKMEWEGDNGHGTMHLDMNANGHTMSMDTTMESHYLGADCGSVKPGSPEIVH